MMGLPGFRILTIKILILIKKITNVWYHLLCTNVGYSLNVPAVKLFSNKNLMIFGLLMLFCFRALIEGKIVFISWFVTVFCFKTAHKIQNISKFIKEQVFFSKWTIDGMQHQFNENWLDREKMGFLRNT